jgi:hypothetical protein
VLFAVLFTEIMARASTGQGLLFRRYKCKLTSSVNTGNAVKQANTSEGEEHNFFQIVNSNPNPKKEFLLSRNIIIWR